MAAISSRVWRASAVEAVIDAVSKSGAKDVWTYRFDWDGEADTWGKAWSKLLGAAHGLEVHFLSGNFDDAALPFEFADPPSRDALSQRMMKQWATFAAQGHPLSDWVPARSQPVVGSSVMSFNAPKDVIQTSENLGTSESILRGWLANLEIAWAEKCERVNEFRQIGLIGVLQGELASQCGSPP
jgi:para-nitrobenzyl esterase